VGPPFSLEPGWRIALEHLEEKERGLAEACREDEQRYAGLIDIENHLKLAQTRLAIALVLMDAIRGTEEESSFRPLHDSAARRAREALGTLEDLRALNVSEDQRSMVTEHADYLEAMRLLEQLFLEGGGALLEDVEHDRARERTVRDAVVRAIRKYVDPDDRYRPVLEPDDARHPAARALARLLGFLFPSLVAPAGDSSGCGIGEDEETIVVSDRMRMPLSQAILYMESELLPALGRQLEDNPGDAAVQMRILGIRRQLAQFRRMRFTPRSTPVVLEKGFYTEWIAGYTPQGELLVNVMLPVTYRTGTNVSRVQELAIGEIVRSLAGRGVCASLDESYDELRAMGSGMRGSSRFPSLRLNIEHGFSALKQDFPHLRALESREEFGRLLEAATRGGRKALEQGVRSLQNGRPARPVPTPFLPE
jgi:hypothetical protein